MTISSRSNHESQRLAELQALGVFESAPESRFDRIIELARHATSSPVAYLSFVGENTSCLKSTSSQFDRVLPRDTSFCSLVVAAEEPILVRDTKKDDRLRDLDWVTGSPHMRFFSGWPIKGPNGFSIGALCIGDTKPKTLSQEDMDAMSIIVDIVQDEITRPVPGGVQQELNTAQRKLASLNRHLENELGKMRAFIASRLPQPLKGKVSSDAVHIPSVQLGGDAFGYHWLDDEFLILYLLDVGGHGVAASLLATSIDDVLRRQGMEGVTFTSPAQVLEALNQLFLMDSVHGSFFTIWYGSFHAPTRNLIFSSGGHHAAVLIDQFSGRAERLFNENMMLGVQVGVEYEESSVKIEPGERLYLYGDGVFEVPTPHRRMLGTDGLEEIIREVQSKPDHRPQAIYQNVMKMSTGEPLNDDFCLIEFEF